jgi:hypothetical protein
MADRSSDPVSDGQQKLSGIILEETSRDVVPRDEKMDGSNGVEGMTA